MIAPTLAPNRTLLVLYGSETGTAQDYAHELGRTAQRLHFDTRVLAMNALSPSLLPTLLPTLPLIIFITSTTGQGDLPSNTSHFWKFLLRKRLPVNFLSKVQFSSFGLGDSTYLKFNWAVKKLHKRVLQLGAREVCERGEGDEQHAEGIDGVFIPWSKRLFEKVLEKWPIPVGMEKILDEVPLPREYILEFDEVEIEKQRNLGLPLTDIHIPRPGVHLATLTRNERVTPQSHFQDVRHITFTTDEDITYSPGDVVSLSPQNLPKDVSLFISLQGWDSIADIPIKITPTPYLLSLTGTSALPPPPPPIPHPVSPLTLRTLLTHHLDITAIPRRSFFAHIANCTSDPLHKERLLEFADPEHIDELWDYTTRPKRTILEVLQEFDSVKLDWREGLLGGGGIGIIRERLFSIASTQKGYPLSTTNTSTNPSRTVDILVAIVHYQTLLKRPRTGLCTRWLRTLTPSPNPTTATSIRIPILILPSISFSSLSSSPSGLTKPLVMIAPGTGIAPMRSLAWERYFLSTTPTSSSPDGEDTNNSPMVGDKAEEKAGDMLLLFGCRTSSADFFFRDEWASWQTIPHSPPPSPSPRRKMYIAFSRDQPKKHYVQDLVREHGDEVFRLLYDERGTVAVCGSSGRMPQAVREALVEVLERGGAEGRGMEREEAERYLGGMEREGRFKQETW
ncbi:sulfite reductase flavoprotein alpha-component [Tirmania nivea]|nr:sulfite reductase flavoprotein alpha-component [Tirmania nivea]